MAAEVRALRAQINPHFLFNALNTIAHLAKTLPVVERAILHLADVFRHALEATRRDVVPLGDELTAIEAYLAIQSARYGAAIRAAVDVPVTLRAAPIPPMVIQPLVENAVQHGLAPKPNGGTVGIAARLANARLRITVADDGVGFEPEHTPYQVGIANVRSRVELAGGVCVVSSAPDRGTTVSLEIPNDGAGR